MGFIPAADFGGRALGFEVEHDHARALLGPLVGCAFFFSFPLGENRRGVCDLGCRSSALNGPVAGEYAEQVDCAGLVEGDVARAARGKVDAGGAADQAIAGFDHGPRQVQEAVELGKALFGEANAAGVIVVHENRSFAELWVLGIAYSADIRAVAQGQQGEERLHGVFNGVDRAHVVVLVAAEVGLEVGVELNPEAYGLNVLHRRFEGVFAEDDLVADADLFVAHHLRADLEPTQPRHKALQRPRAQFL